MHFYGDVIWIKEAYGGRRSPPVEGLRPIIRFQRDVRAWLAEAWDVEVVELKIDETTWDSQVKFKFTSRAISRNKDFILRDNLFELLDGYRVIGVGRITAVVQ